MVVDEPELPPGATKPVKALLDVPAEDTGLLPVVPKPDIEAVAVTDAVAELLPKPEN